MKILVCCTLLLMAVLPVQSSAQEHEWMTDSSWAIQFGIQSNMTLGSFDAANLSAKTHITSLQALRIGLNLYGANNRQETFQERSIGDSVFYQVTGSAWQNDFTIGATVQYLWYLDTKSDLFVFFGVGPTGRFRWSDSDFGEHRAAWAIGIAPVLGGEWFATRRISFHAEYQATLFYERSTSSYEDNSSETRFYRENTYTRWGFSADGVVFGLSVYFDL